MFRAYDAQRERLVAVKLFKLDLPPERVHQLVAAFERLIAADLSHPVLASPLATGVTEVSAFLVQDYVAAESLDLAVREYGAVPPADAVRIAAQLGGALDFGAVADIFHGALHPRDVLLSTDETRLTGLGVARALEQVGVAAPVRRPYTAPERIAGGPVGSPGRHLQPGGADPRIAVGPPRVGHRQAGRRGVDRDSRRRPRDAARRVQRTRWPTSRPIALKPGSSLPRP